MNRDPSRWMQVLLCLTLSLAAPATETVPQALAKILNQAQELAQAGQHVAALAALDGYRGDAHPLYFVVRGQTRVLAGDQPAALVAFTRALELDPQRREAGLGVINALLALDRPAEALPHCGRWLSLEDGNGEALEVYAHAAWRAGDRPLAWRIATRAMVRFPDRANLRRLLLNLAIELEDWSQAEVLVRDLQRRDPQDPTLWRLRASLRQRQPNTDETTVRVACEAALLAAPDDQSLRQSLIGLQLAARHHQAALANARVLLAAQKEPAPTLIALVVHCALVAGNLDDAATWLARIPPADRDRRLHLLAVRLALAQGDKTRARQDLEAVLDASQADDGVLIQAAILDQELGQTTRAEALLRQCLASGGRHAGTARLHLIRILYQQRRFNEAAEEVQRHLDQHPADPIAERLRTAIDTARSRQE